MESTAELHRAVYEAVQSRTRTGKAPCFPGEDTMPGANLTEAALEAFETSLRGELLRPESDGYDEARGLWNAMIDARHALIARCTGVVDVIAAVRFARTNGLTAAATRPLGTSARGVQLARHSSAFAGALRH
jgi:hypothetical protein